MKIVDVVLTIDGLHLEDDQSVEDVIQHIQSKFYTAYEIQYLKTYEDDLND